MTHDDHESYAGMDDQSMQIERHKAIVKSAVRSICMDTYRYCTDPQLCRDSGCQAAAQRRLEMSCHGDEQMYKVSQMHPKRGTERAMGIEEPKADRRATRIFWRIYFALLPLIIVGVGMWIYHYGKTFKEFLK